MIADSATPSYSRDENLYGILANRDREAEDTTDFYDNHLFAFRS